MNLIVRLTEATCGDSCWHARDEICRCSCGGRNHGVLRNSNGEQPQRTARMAGVMRKLAAVGTDDLDAEAQRINREAGEHYWPIAHTNTSFPNAPAKLTLATAGQIERWPELAAWRNQEGPTYFHKRPRLLWLLTCATHAPAEHARQEELFAWASPSRFTFEPTRAHATTATRTARSCPTRYAVAMHY